MKLIKTPPAGLRDAAPSFSAEEDALRWFWLPHEVQQFEQKGAA